MVVYLESEILLIKPSKTFQIDGALKLNDFKWWDFET